jgi:hypothetical protein
MFGRLKKWLSGQPKRRRWPAPDELTEIMSGLPDGWRLVSYKYWQMGWEAYIQASRRSFQLVSDRGYVNVHANVGGKLQQIMPPKDQRMSITPEQIRQLLMSATVAEKN